MEQDYCCTLLLILRVILTIIHSDYQGSLFCSRLTKIDFLVTAALPWLLLLSLHLCRIRFLYVRVIRFFLSVHDSLFCASVTFKIRSISTCVRVSHSDGYLHRIFRDCFTQVNSFSKKTITSPMSISKDVLLILI